MESKDTDDTAGAMTDADLEAVSGGMNPQDLIANPLQPGRVGLFPSE